MKTREIVREYKQGRKEIMKKYTLKMFMEDYKGFDFENGEIVLFDADLCRQYLLSTKSYKMTHLTEERLSKHTHDWKHSDTTMAVILKEYPGQSQ